MDLTNFKGFLDYPGLDYYDEKNKTWTEEKIAVETERAKTAESTLTTNLNNEISRAKKAEENNATSINNEVARATNAENTLATNLSSHTSNKSNPHGVTKTHVGLGNVDNTSDANKPISTATQTALDTKAPLASPTLTGTPKAPTATAGNNTTQIATTAFVQNAIINKAELDENGIILSSQLPFSITKSETKPTIIGALSDIVYNSNPISGDYVGWVYTPSGWFGFGKIEIASNGIELSDGSAFVLSNGELFLTYDN